jgi:chromate transporter
LISDGREDGSVGADAAEAPAPSLWALARVYLGISLLGFGGPNAHLALMLDEVVERRGWLSRERFLELMAVTNLLPGPNSSEVAIHVGYTQRGWPGAMATGLAFLTPTFVMVTALSAAYFRLGSLPQIDALFWGVQPVIVAIVIAAGVKIGRAAIQERWQLGFAAIGAAVSLVSGPAIIGLMVLAGLVTGWWRGGRGGSAPSRVARSVTLLPAVLSVGVLGPLGTVFLLHLAIGSVLFGGGYVLVALLQPYAVGEFGWLTASQFLDGVALTQAVPGPISTLSAFVGYAAAGLPGAVLGTVGVYLPAFAFVLFAAPRLERMRDLPWVSSALTGVVPVAAGAVLGVGVDLTIAGVRDPVAGAIATLALAAAVWKKVPSLWLIGVGLGLGLARWLLSGA